MEESEEREPPTPELSSYWQTQNSSGFQILSLASKENELPYIIDNKTGFRILLETGSRKSFVKKTIAEAYFCESLKHTPFEVTTRHGTTKEKYSTRVGITELTGIKGKTAEFYLFDFHDHFDLLLGLDLIKELGVIINFEKNK